MTQKNGHEPENRNWMDIAEGDAINEVRHSRGRLPFVVAAIALVAVGGGALFAQTNNPAPSQVQPSSVVTAVATALPTTGRQVTSQQATLTPPVVSTGIPTIAPVAGGGYNGDDDDDYEDDDDDDREDDDDYEDDDDDDEDDD
jgi:hypothetical protein